MVVFSFVFSEGNVPIAAVILITMVVIYAIRDIDRYEISD